MSSSTPPKKKHYAEVNPQAKFPQIEERILALWKEKQTFKRSVEGRPAGSKGSNEFVFYDGPPFANGLPHYGHLLTGYIKDLMPRYQTMRGKRVERRFGWDCHGLPAEMESEKELKISGRQAIQEFGIFKGIALTADRLSRCNRVAATSIELLRINLQTGRVVDLPIMYRVKSKDVQ